MHNIMHGFPLFSNLGVLYKTYMINSTVKLRCIIGSLTPTSGGSLRHTRGYSTTVNSFWLYRSLAGKLDFLYGYPESPSVP
jgi:hypothetical protein